MVQDLLDVSPLTVKLKQSGEGDKSLNSWPDYIIHTCTTKIMPIAVT